MNLTAEQIIKALEEWRKELVLDYQRLKLLNAPMDCFEESHGDTITNLTNALDLINRLEAENGRLQKQIEALQMENNQLQSDIIIANNNYEHIKELWNAEKERRKRVLDHLKAVLAERADHSEAVNEFAERFLKKVHDNHYLLSDRNNSKDYGMFTVGIEQAVNETKEEMAGKTE